MTLYDYISNSSLLNEVSGEKKLIRFLRLMRKYKDTPELRTHVMKHPGEPGSNAVKRNYRAINKYPTPENPPTPGMHKAMGAMFKKKTGIEDLNPTENPVKFYRLVGELSKKGPYGEKMSNYIQRHVLK